MARESPRASVPDNRRLKERNMPQIILCPQYARVAVGFDIISLVCVFSKDSTQSSVQAKTGSSVGSANYTRMVISHTLPSKLLSRFWALTENIANQFL